MESLTAVSTVHPLYLGSVHMNDKKSVDNCTEGSPMFEQTPLVTHKVDAVTGGLLIPPEDSVKMKSSDQISSPPPPPPPPALPLLPHKTSVTSQVASVNMSPASAAAASAICSNMLPFGTSPHYDISNTKAESGTGFQLEFVSKSACEVGPQFDPKYSPGTSVGDCLPYDNGGVVSEAHLSKVSCTSWPLTDTQALQTTAAASSQLSKPNVQCQRTDLPQPPKKPLSPYMRFSKGIWQQVKTAHPSMSVCEVGATIGRIWRELDDANKRRFIDEFNNDKARYDTELQGYLKTNGLQASDLIKPRAKKNSKDPSASKRSKVQQQTKVQNVLVDNQKGTNCHPSVPQFTEGQPTTVFMGQETTNQEMSSTGTLPSFSQVWRNTDQTTQRDLLAQVVYDSHLNDEQDVTESSQAVSMFSDQVTAGRLTTGQMSADKVNQIHQNTTSHLNMNASNWWWTTTGNNERYHMQPPEETSKTGQHSGAGALFPEVKIKAEDGILTKTETGMSDCGWNERSATVVGKQEVPEEKLTGQPGLAPGVRNDKGTVVDAEKLFLRSALVEKTQEVVQLMRELEQAYGLIHQLKQQNDFFLRWYQEQKSTPE